MIGRWRDEVGDGYVASFVRMVLGLLLFWQSLRAGKELLSVGYFGDGFHMSFLPEAAVPSRLVISVTPRPRCSLPP